MGARQSKRSVDITTTPKKDGLPAEGSVAGDAAAPGDGKLERIEESDGKPTTNGTAPHADVLLDEKDKEKEKEKEKDKENENDKEKEKDKDEDTEKEDVKVEDTRPESNTEGPAEAEEVTTPTEGVTPTSPESATSPESKDAKKKDKKKKWSFRSLSFGKRDRSKTARDDAPKNGDVTKEEPLAEGGEEAEAAVPVEESPVEEKTAVSSPTVESTTPPAPVKEEEKAAPVSSPTPVEEKKEEPTPAPTPVVPVEEKKEEIEKVEPVVVADKVEVSPVQAISPVGVTQAQKIATPSIIERKTSEDLPPPLPSSPPPTPIDPSPLQQAQHTAANASALAEALKVPAEAASMASQIAKEPIDASRFVDESISKVVAQSSIVDNNLTNESVTSTVAELVTDVRDSISEVKETQSRSESLKESEIVAEVAKSEESLPEASSEFEIIPSQVESKIAVNEPREIVENGVSGLDSASSDNIVSLAKDADGTEIVESIIARDESDLCRRGDLVIQSEEGPLPLSEESLVEAKPAFVVPEDDSDEAIVKAVETIDLKASQGVEEESVGPVDVVLEADDIPAIESDSKTALPDPGFVEVEQPEVKSPEISSVEAIQAQSETVLSTKTDDVEDVVPPLPESPIPSFEKSQGIGELLSEKIDESSDLTINSKDGASIDSYAKDISGQLESEVVFDPIEELRACHMSVDGLLSPAEKTLGELSTSLTDVLNVSASSPLVEKLASPVNDLLPDFPSPPFLAKDVSNLLDDLPVPPNDIYTANEEAPICLIPTKNISSPIEDLAVPEICPILKTVADTESVILNGSFAKETLTPIDLSNTKILNETPDSPTLNPSPANLLISPKESLESKLIDDQSNQEFEVESLSQSLNSYNDSDVQLKERLAESEGLMNGVENATSCPLLKAVPTAVPDNAQKIAEPEAPAENPAEISTTESVNEAPASPAPPVPAELPILPPSEPAITEDVASVTKAIEETDISDKAVAAAVNEAIESANTNEIVNDSHHQNVINE